MAKPRDSLMAGFDVVFVAAVGMHGVGVAVQHLRLGPNWPYCFNSFSRLSGFEVAEPVEYAHFVRVISEVGEMSWWFPKVSWYRRQTCRVSGMISFGHICLPARNLSPPLPAAPVDCHSRGGEPNSIFQRKLRLLGHRHDYRSGFWGPP